MTAVPPTKIYSKMTAVASVAITTTAASSGLSDAIDLGGHTLSSIHVSTRWVNAALSFQGSLDGTNYFDVFTTTGGELIYGTSGSSAMVSKIISFDPATFSGIPYFKIRSGGTTAPITQGSSADPGSVTLTLGLYKSTPSQ